MYKVKIYVTLRENVIDPQGAATKNTLHDLNYNEVENLRIGKYMELSLQKGDYDVQARVKEMCEKLLVNTIVEDYRFEVEEV